MTINLTKLELKLLREMTAAAITSANFIGVDSADWARLSEKLALAAVDGITTDGSSLAKVAEYFGADVLKLITYGRNNRPRAIVVYAKGAKLARAIDKAVDRITDAEDGTLMEGKEVD